MKAMFLPLKSQYFDAFKAGTKTVEYRRYCKRWDERTCAIGRPVVLSRGYGKHDRLSGVISGFERRHMASTEWVDCYGEPGWAACISITLDSQSTVEDEPKREMWVTCSNCSHRWIGLYLPMPIREAARVMGRLTCPKCACSKILVKPRTIETTPHTSEGGQHGPTAQADA
jgi:DNA-directed RNA polymerase subunit RPC12/RpoP